MSERPKRAPPLPELLVVLTAYAPRFVCTKCLVVILGVAFECDETSIDGEINQHVVEGRAEIQRGECLNCGMTRMVARVRTDHRAAGHNSSPLVASHPVADTPSQVPSFSRRETATQPLVLFVDDNPDGRDAYARFFEFAGFRVATAADGYEAIESARSLQPDLIVMDWAMPRMTGLEATRVLKADPATRGICVILLTGNAILAAERQSIEEGCDRFLVKPLPPDDLVGVVRDVLSKRAASIQ